MHLPASSQEEHSSSSDGEDLKYMYSMCIDVYRVFFCYVGKECAVF